MKKTVIFLISLLLAISFTSCKKCEHTYDNACDISCNACGEAREVSAHNYENATCTAAKTCTVCGLTEGNALGHIFEAADCDTLKTCTVCGATDGTARGHAFVDANCDTARKCTACGLTDGEAFGHSFADADCITPKTCTVCGKTNGDALGHSAEDDGDCTTDVVCTICEAVVVEGAEEHTADHDDGDCTTSVYCLACDFEIIPANENHVGGTATCLDLAVCEACGLAYGVNDLNNHASSDTRSSYFDLETHVTYYNCCNEIAGYGEHNGAPATCLSYSYCTVCSMAYNDLDFDNHESTELYYVGTDGEKHEVHYSCCHKLITEESHVADESVPPTCSTRTRCVDCGNEFGELDPDNHRLNSYIYENNGDGTHTGFYACCYQGLDSEECSVGKANCTSGRSCVLCRYQFDTELNPYVHPIASVDESGSCICGVSDIVASVGEYAYTVFYDAYDVDSPYNKDDAIDNWIDGTTLKLYKNVTAYTRISVRGGNRTLDLNGYKMENPYSVTLEVYDMELDIIGKMGSMLYGSDDVALYISSSTVTISEGVTLVSEYRATGSAGVIQLRSGSTLIINGASVIADTSIYAISVYQGSKLVMNSGVLSSKGSVIEVSSSVAELNGGSIETTAYVSYSGVFIIGSSTVTVKDTMFTREALCSDISISAYNDSSVSTIDFTDASEMTYKISIGGASNPISTDTFKYDSDEYVLSTDIGAVDGMYNGGTVITLAKVE